MIIRFFDVTIEPLIKVVDAYLNYADSIMPHHNYFSAANLATTAHALAYLSNGTLVALRNNCVMDQLEFVFNKDGFDGDFPKKKIAMQAIPLAQDTYGSIALPHGSDINRYEAWVAFAHEFNAKAEEKCIPKILAIKIWSD